MKNPIHFDIKESLSELKTLRSKQSTLSRQKRVDCLIHLKAFKFKTRQELANHLGIHIRTQERWLIQYRTGGIASYISDEPPIRPSKIISPEIHDALETRVNSSDSPFLGYWEAQQWVEDTFNVQIKYHWLRKYLITHFKTKLKSPRKSHYKKMNRLLKPFLKLPDTFHDLRISLDKNNYSGINLYFQDESRFGLMTHIGKYLTARGVKPIVKYQHAFKNTYLYGSYSPVNGDSFVWEINGTDTKIFEAYLQAFSKHRETEYKIVVIDNARFHSTKNIDVPDNIFLLNIPPYCPELNPCEKIWQHIKSRFKNHTFGTMKNVKEWLVESVNQMTEKQIMSITHNKKYLDSFNAAF